MAVVMATGPTTSIIHASPTPTCRFFMDTSSSSPCAISSLVRKLRSTINQRFTQTKKGASVAHLPAAGRSINRGTGERRKGERVKGKGEGGSKRQDTKQALCSVLPFTHSPFPPVFLKPGQGKTEFRSPSNFRIEVHSSAVLFNHFPHKRQAESG